MSNLLSNLWKSATTPPDGKYENLAGKHTRRSDTKEVILINRFTEHFDGLVAIDNKGNWVTMPMIEYLDESEEAVKEFLRNAFYSFVSYKLGPAWKGGTGEEEFNKDFIQWLLTKEAEHDK